MKQELIILYEKMAQLTKPECASCRAPHSCCSPEYCEAATEYALDEGIILERTGHPRLPYMGPKGCVVPPHLRPLCTVHTCDIASLGFKRGKDGDVWTKKYFKLRDKINLLEER